MICSVNGTKPLSGAYPAAIASRLSDFPPRRNRVRAWVFTSGFRLGGGGRTAQAEAEPLNRTAERGASRQSKAPPAGADTRYRRYDTLKVRNINGTSDNPHCPCGSWLNHWKKYAGANNPACAEVSCREEAEVGAHVQKIGDDHSWYIVPLCKKHNGLHGQELDIMDNVQLVSVTARNKCGG
jgi:hypothetical protein